MMLKIFGFLGFVVALDYATLARDLDWAAVKADVVDVFTTSQPFWPSDYGHYGPFFIRLAWHCSGSYRKFDGRGGCRGGRIRFDPERSWNDNTNLDKALELLRPIKLKYGDGLSWGDLITFTGTVAIENMGGPVLGFCAGRQDEEDGSRSLVLGPTAEQELLFPCEVDGDCQPPLGPTTVGLIYVNPEGPFGVPNPNASAVQIRDTFGRMGLSDTETVALIGGGHTFGKAHGACPSGPGPRPSESPFRPWPGTCGPAPHALLDAFTSGFEGPWTRNPTSWDGDYWTQLTGQRWAPTDGPGGHKQWHSTGVDGAGSPKAPNAAHNGTQDLMMLTSDIALLSDPAFHQNVLAFKSNLSHFEDQFKRAWYKLTTRDMGPATRCIDTKLAKFGLPPAQAFQHPLPPGPSAVPVARVKAAILAALSKQSAAMKPDRVDGKPYYGAIFTRLAFQCANTFRTTDFRGGCNGASIRFLPQLNFTENAVWAAQAIQLLQPIKDRFGSSLSFADLITLAGQVAIEQASGLALDFCPGRADFTDGSAAVDLEPPRPRGNLTDFALSPLELQEGAFKLGLSNEEFVALFAQLRSSVIQSTQGHGTWTTALNKLSNDYFKVLVNNKWEPFGSQFRAVGNATVFMRRDDVSLTMSPAHLHIAERFAADNTLFLAAFARAWTTLANADRFAGPTGNVCSPAAEAPNRNKKTKAQSKTSPRHNN